MELTAKKYLLSHGIKTDVKLLCLIDGEFSSVHISSLLEGYHAAKKTEGREEAIKKIKQAIFDD